MPQGAASDHSCLVTVCVLGANGAVYGLFRVNDQEVFRSSIVDLATYVQWARSSRRSIYADAPSLGFATGVHGKYLFFVLPYCQHSRVSKRRRLSALVLPLTCCTS